MAARNSAVPNEGTPRSPRYAKYEVKSVARALTLLDLLSEHAEDGLTVTEIAAALGASKSATFAMLQTLLAHGYAADLEPGPRYTLGPAVLRLADSHTQSISLLEVVRPVMRALTEATGWTSRVAVHDHGYPIFVERVDGQGSIRFYTPLGIREMPHRSAAGKAILADLDEAVVRTIADETGLPRQTSHTITSVDALLADLELVRSRGFAIDDEEDEPGVVCVGASFGGRDGRPAGAVSITGLKAELPEWKLQELGRVVRSHADQMAMAIGGRPWRAPHAARESR